MNLMHEPLLRPAMSQGSMLAASVAGPRRSKDVAGPGEGWSFDVSTLAAKRGGVVQLHTPTTATYDVTVINRGERVDLGGHHGGVSGGPLGNSTVASAPPVSLNSFPVHCAGAVQW
jgi:hypothetical protein